MVTYSTSIMKPLSTPMNKEVRKFMDEVRGWFGDLEGGLQVAHREALKIFFHTVYNNTPVLSGYAAYNWDVAISEEPNSSLEPRVREIHGRRADGQPNVVQSYFGHRNDPDWNRVRWNSRTMVYNYVPYIYIINNQSSSPGFFEHATKVTESFLQARLKSI